MLCFYLHPVFATLNSTKVNNSACYTAALTVIAADFVFGLLCRLWCRR